jgi:hypothetical protein
MVDRLMEKNHPFGRFFHVKESVIIMIAPGAVKPGGA